MAIEIDLAGRVAMVCGASQGIGRSAALALARAGARVVLSGRNEEGLAKVLGELPASPSGAHEVLCRTTPTRPPWNARPMRWWLGWVPCMCWW